MMTSSNGNMFRTTGFCTGNSPVTAGNSPVTGEFPSHRPVMRSFGVFFDLRLKKRFSKQSRRRWFERPLLSLWRHCNVVPNSDPVIRAAVGSFGVQRDTFVQFLIVETGQIGRFLALWKEWPQIWHTALPWLPFLEINDILHSAPVLSLWCQIIHKLLVLSWGGNKWNTFFIRMSNLHAMSVTNITHSACYTVEMGASAGDLTRITLDNNHTAYKHICLQVIGCVCVKNYPPEIMQPSSSKWCNHRQGHMFLLPLLHRMGIK